MRADFATALAENPLNVREQFDAGFSLARGFAALGDESRQIVIVSLCGGKRTGLCVQQQQFCHMIAFVAPLARCPVSFLGSAES